MLQDSQNQLNRHDYETARLSISLPMLWNKDVIVFYVCHVRFFAHNVA